MWCLYLKEPKARAHISPIATTAFCSRSYPFGRFPSKMPQNDLGLVVVSSLSLSPENLKIKTKPLSKHSTVADPNFPRSLPFIISDFTHPFARASKRQPKVCRFLSTLSLAFLFFRVSSKYQFAWQISNACLVIDMLCFFLFSLLNSGLILLIFFHTR